MCSLSYRALITHGMLSQSLEWVHSWWQSAHHGRLLVCNWCYCVLKQDDKLSQSQNMLALMVAVRIMDAV
jgi:hypothetical protein